MLVWQAAQLLIEQWLHVTPEVWFGPSFRFRHLVHLLFSGLPLRSRRPRLQSGLVGYTKEPVGEHLPRHDGCGLTDEDKKRSLKRIFGVMVIAEDSMAH